MESVKDEDGEEDVEKERNGEDTALEVPGMPVEGCEVYVVGIEG